MDSPKPLVLVVEDTPDTLKLLEVTLTFKGHRVATATNGQEALRAIEQERPALIITDILMPQTDGFNLVHRLRLNADTRDLPIIFLSATYVAPEDKAFAVSIGVTRFIEKPINMQELLDTVTELLKHGAHKIQKPLDEGAFYDGYRKRLEIKLRQKIAQIGRTENLLQTLTSEEKKSFQASLQLTISERDEIQQLLEQIHNQLKVDGKKSK